MAVAAVDASIGIMDPAYFVGRAEILDWLNGALQLKIGRIEDTCTGAVACQVVDSLFPGVVQMSKVNWGAKSEHEYVANYKVLQAAFAQLKVDRYVDVDKLIKGKYLDNFEMMQWLRKFHSNNETGLPYDPVARRALGKNADKLVSKKPSAANAAAAKPVPAVTSRPVNKPAPAAAASTATSKPKAATTATTGAEHKIIKPAIHVVEKSANETKENTDSLKVANAALQSRISVLEAEVASARQLAERICVVEKERDFYFGKCRDVEVLLEGADSDGLGKAIAHVLFAADDEEDDLEDAQAGEDGGVEQCAEAPLVDAEEA